MSNEEVSAPFEINWEGMRAYLATSDVVFAIVFGSHANDTADISSDVDIAIRFSEDMSQEHRFRGRNRIDAELQRYADGFVDVSDIETLPLPVKFAAVRDGEILVGNPETVAAYRARIADRYERSAQDRKQDRDAFIERLARGEM